MPIITFWSENQKPIGQTVAASVAATNMAVDYNYKILLVSVDFNNNMLEMSFGAQESNKKIVKNLVQSNQMNLGSGIEGLMKLANSNRITPEIIHDYTKIIFKNRFEILYSPVNMEKEEDKANIMAKMKNIIMNASRYYDQVIVDLKKGNEYSQQEEILNLSDIIVLNVDQRVDSIESLLDNEFVKKNSKKIIWNICKYDKNSKYNAKNLARKYFKKEVVHTIPYNTLISEVTQEEMLVELILKFRTLREEGENLEFVSSVRELLEEILLRYKLTRSMM